MDFLLDYNISQETINMIKENHDDSMIFSILCFKDNVLNVISYLQSIHVSVIDSLLVNRLELFLIPVSLIQEHFENYNVSVLVQLLNEDINVLNNV